MLRRARYADRTLTLERDANQRVIEPLALLPAARAALKRAPIPPFHTGAVLRSARRDLSPVFWCPF